MDVHTNNNNIIIIIYIISHALEKNWKILSLFFSRQKFWIFVEKMPKYSNNLHEHENKFIVHHRMCTTKISLFLDRDLMISKSEMKNQLHIKACHVRALEIYFSSCSPLFGFIFTIKNWNSKNYDHQSLLF